MKLTKKKKTVIAKEKRFNPHRFWIYYLSFFVILLTLQIATFSFYFMHISKILDTPVLPKLETNAFKIKSMQNLVDKIDIAVKDRVGDAPTSVPVVVPTTNKVEEKPLTVQ